MQTHRDSSSDDTLIVVGTIVITLIVGLIAAVMS